MNHRILQLVRAFGQAAHAMLPGPSITSAGAGPPPATCEYEVPGYECQEPALPGQNRCLFHADMTKDVVSFWTGVRQRLAARQYDFRGFVFPEHGDERFVSQEFGGDANFQGAIFKGSIYFNGAHFNGIVEFGGAHFEQAAYFNGAVFHRNADFNAAMFAQACQFSEASFHEAGTFAQAHFEGLTLFRGTSFARRANFSACVIEGQIVMDGASFADEADFTDAIFVHAPGLDARFRGRVLLDGIEFPERAAFGGAVFADAASVSFVGSDLTHVVFRATPLTACRFRDSHNLSKAEFDQVMWPTWPPPERWRSWTGRRPAVADEIDARTDPRATPQERRARLRATERVYREIRSSYETRKDWDRASEFYYAEMEMRRLVARSNWLTRRVGSLIGWYGLLSGYGERWVRAAVWLIAIWIIAAWLYVSIGLWIKVVQPSPDGLGLLQTRLYYVGMSVGWPSPTQYQEVVDRAGSALLHSFLVITFVGRDIYGIPVNGWGHVVQAIESSVGPLVLGLLILAVRRRFQR